MNKTVMVMCLGTITASSLVFADENSVFSEPLKTDMQDVGIGRLCPLTCSFSLRAGYFGLKGDDNLVDDGVGGQAEMKFALADSAFDLVLRGHGASAESDDDEIWVSDPTVFYYGNTRMAAAVAFDNIEETVIGGSVQLQYNFARGATANPYIAAGVMYEKSEIEFDAGYAVTNGRRYAAAGWHEKMDEDGFAVVGRAGVELNAEPAYARLEAAAVSEIYDDDGTQAELNAIVGATVLDNLRLELSGTYFTEWKEYYILGGVTFLF